MKKQKEYSASFKAEVVKEILKVTMIQEIKPPDRKVVN